MDETEKLTSSCHTVNYYPGGVLGAEVRRGFQRPSQVETEVPGKLSWSRNEELKGIFQEAATAVESLQSCLTLHDPIDSSSPGSSVPGILQAGTLEWVAISFSNACMHAKSLQSCSTLWNPMDSSPPGSSVHRPLQARILEWVAISFSIIQEERTAKANARRTMKFERKRREDQGGGVGGHTVWGICCDETTGHLVQRRLESGDINGTRTPRASYVFGYQVDLHLLFSLWTA